MTDLPKTKKFSRPKTSEIEDFKSWLANLESAPKLHVNGPGYSMAVVTVDFGTPLEEVVAKITVEQNAELMSRMKTLTRSLHKSEVNVRVQNDTNNGVWWTTVA